MVFTTTKSKLTTIKLKFTTTERWLTAKTSNCWQKFKSCNFQSRIKWLESKKTHPKCSRSWRTRSPRRWSSPPSSISWRKQPRYVSNSGAIKYSIVDFSLHSQEKFLAVWGLFLITYLYLQTLYSFSTKQIDAIRKHRQLFLAVIRAPLRLLGRTRTTSALLRMVTGNKSPSPTDN